MAKEKKKKRFIFKLMKFIVIFATIVALVILYAHFIGTKGLFVDEYKISNSKLSNHFYGFKIAHISDIHYGRTIKKNELEKIVKKVNDTKPDLIILSGDLIDKDTVLTDSMIKDITSTLSKLKPNIGSYAITGNHDTMFTEWASIVEESGFINLNDTYETIYKGTSNYMLLSGLSSVTNKKKTLEEKLANTKAFISTLNDTNQPEYKILVLHEGDIVDEFDTSGYDLILGGHSHNGQVRLPVIGALLLPSYGKKYYKEYYSLNNGKTDFYISSGIGTSNIDVRLFDRPSFNLYRFTNK